MEEVVVEETLDIVVSKNLVAGSVVVAVVVVVVVVFNRPGTSGGGGFLVTGVLGSDTLLCTARTLSMLRHDAYTLRRLIRTPTRTQCPFFSFACFRRQPRPHFLLSFLLCAFDRPSEDLASLLCCCQLSGLPLSCSTQCFGHLPSPRQHHPPLSHQTTISFASTTPLVSASPTSRTLTSIDANTPTFSLLPFPTLLCVLIHLGTRLFSSSPSRPFELTCSITPT